MVEIPLWVTAIACTLSLALSLAAFLWCSVFSRPAAFRNAVEALRKEQVLVQGDCDAVRREFLTHRTEMATIADSVEGMLENVERKRKQTTTAAQRLQGGAEAVPTTRAEMVALGRRQVASGG